MRPVFTTLLALAALVSWPVCAKELMIKELSMPQFDADGVMVRRLVSESVTGPLEEPRLAQGTVEFFRTLGKVTEKVATLDFNDAVCNRAAGRITGTGRICLKSSFGEISGVGYVYEMPTGKLTLKSQVVMDFPMAHVEGREGEAYFVQSGPGQDYSVSRATVLGVVVTGLKSTEYPFERVATASGTYTAEDGILRAASPMKGWSKGVETVVNAKEIALKVGPAAQLDGKVKAAESGRKADDANGK